MFPARGEFTKLGKGSLLLDLYNPNTGLLSGASFVGNASAISVSSDTQTAELFSNTQAAGGLVSSTRTRLSYAVTATLNEFTMENLAMFLAGTIVQANQAAVVGATKPIVDALEGRYYELGARKVTAVSGVKDAGAVALVLGDDYDLNAEHGVVYLRPGASHFADGDELTFTFTKGALNIRQLRIGQAGAQVGKLIYLSDDANIDGKSAHDKLTIWKVNINPDGELNFVSDDYGSYNLSMAVISDGSAHPNDPFGILERVE